MPSGDDMMVTFMIGDRMSSYTYDWMSGGLENKMITANLADAAGAMGRARHGRLGRRSRRRRTERRFGSLR